VDGVNVVTGESAHPSQTGYIVGPGQSVTIDGWRKNLSKSAAFYFTALSDSYAARTGRPGNVGVIGVAAFEEARPPELARPMPQRRYAPKVEENSAEGASARADAGRAMEPQSPSASVPSMEKQMDSRLGTGHGETQYSPVRRGEFTRASSQPAQVVALRYESRPSLIKMGVLPPPVRRHHEYRPDPFPGFVPDPPRYR
jgi:hypothetical protein